MADVPAKPRLLEIAEHLKLHGVEFMVIGGQAATLLGSPLPTFDIDLCYRRTAANLDDLIVIKRHIGRPKDKAALAQLEVIKQTRGQPATGEPPPSAGGT